MLSCLGLTQFFRTLTLGRVESAGAPSSLPQFIFSFVGKKCLLRAGRLQGPEPSWCLYMTNLTELPFKLIYCFTASYKSGSHM